MIGESTQILLSFSFILMHLWTNLRGIRAFHLVATKVSSVFSVEGGIFLALCKIVTVSNPRPGEPRGAQEFMSSPYTHKSIYHIYLY